MTKLGDFLYSNTVELEKIRMGMIQTFSEYLLDVDMEIIQRHITDAFSVNIKGYLWGEEAAKREIQYPQDWWQAFKERWFPKCLLKKYPVIYTHIVMEAKAIYPNFRQSLPNESCTIIVMEPMNVWRRDDT